MRFVITIEVSYRRYRYTVEHQLVDERTEHFTVFYKNGRFVIESNRPYFLSHPGLKKRRPIMKVIEGAPTLNIGFLKKVYDALEVWFPKLPHQLSK